MRRLAALVTILSAACTSPTATGASTASVGEEQPSAAPAPPAAPSTAARRVAPRPAPTSAAIGDRRTATLDLLRGAADVDALPVEATHLDGPLDVGLRDELAPRGGPGDVRLDGVTISGRLAREAVIPPLEARSDAVRGCYHRGLAGNASLGGEVAVTLHVTERGDATDVEATAVDLPDRGVVECVRAALAGLRFAEPAGGRASVRLAWRLRPRP